MLLRQISWVRDLKTFIVLDENSNRKKGADSLKWSGDSDDLKVQRDVELLRQKYCSTKSSVLRVFSGGQTKANEAFLKSKVIRVVARNIRGGCNLLLVICSNKVSTDKLEKTSLFF